MRVDVIQHIAFEGPAAVGQWAEQRGHELMVHRLDLAAPLPIADQLELLVILGGPMSVNDLEPDWIAAERELICAAIERQVPILGICLGAQQIAKALGAEVIAGTREVGWQPVRRVSQRYEFVPETLTVLHWHGEQFGIPAGAERLFASDVCANQGFVYSERVIGLQFHFESTPESVELLLQHDADYLDGSEYVQNAADISSFHIPSSNREVLYGLLDVLVRAAVSS
ncbi:type 1 glutamine amidotransferase [Paenibacillus sp. WLX1005]|uniref:type 1 glutamine amidotransferase n=1 Tax=Paenibacillus sp. WLX1005 TaxID=3243766 RepID=UPI003983ECC3